MLPSPVQRWLEEKGHGSLVSRRPVSGGSISSTMVFVTSSGARFFLKTNAHCPPDMFAREAEGLAALDRPGAPRVPRVHLSGSQFILMEDLAPAGPASDYWIRFGREMARLHQTVADRFGFHHDNYIGSTPQPNDWEDDGVVFFARHRLAFQADLAQSRGLLPLSDRSRVDRMIQKLPELVPVQPASLLHGDLWTGNALSDEGGRPAIIDPAAHYGWAEAELAMTTLFGTFPEAFFRAYVAERPLPAGYRDRFPIYNLYHLLNHLNLFGGGYLGSVQSVLRRFA